jgi:hypothetical protein
MSFSSDRSGLRVTGSGMRSASCVDSKRYDVREASAVFFRVRKYVNEVIGKSVYPTMGRRRRDDSEWRRKSDGDRLRKADWSWSYRLCGTVKL